MLTLHIALGAVCVGFAARYWVNHQRFDALVSEYGSFDPVVHVDMHTVTA